MLLCSSDFHPENERCFIYHTFPRIAGINVSVGFYPHLLDTSVDVSDRFYISL